MAVQYLTDKNDRRAQFLHVAVPPSTQPKMKTSSAGNLKETQPSSHKTTSEKKQNETSDNRDTENAVKPDTMQRCKEQIKKLINNLSDCKSDDSKQPASKTNEYVSQTTYDEVETACSESAKERIPAENSDNEETYEEDVDLELDFKEDEEEIDPKVFGILEREVECCDNVLKTLKDKKVPLEMKQRVIKKIQLLASDQSHSYKIVRGTTSTLNLFQTKFSKRGRILWEWATAFSPRETEPKKRHETKGNVRIYSEIIRLWDIVFDQSHHKRAIENIIRNHENGKQCLNKRTLKQLEDTVQLRNEFLKMK